KKFHWSDECDANFRMLKDKLSCGPVVFLPNWDAPVLVTSDASELGMSAVLSQEIDGERKVIEFVSKSFTDTERRYSTIEKEATAILVALEKWQHYLLGREVTVETDHKPLIWLLSKKDCGGKLGRMALRLQEFNIKGIEHVKGED